MHLLVKRILRESWFARKASGLLWLYEATISHKWNSFIQCWVLNILTQDKMSSAIQRLSQKSPWKWVDVTEESCWDVVMWVELVTGSMDRENMQRKKVWKRISAPEALVWDCSIPSVIKWVREGWFLVSVKGRWSH